MKLEADFSQISSSFEPLEADVEYKFKLVEITDQANDDEWKQKNATSDKTPALVFVSEVVEGDRTGAKMFDYIYTKTKDGKINKPGLGKIKAYAEAILGKEAANGTALDTDALINGEFIGIPKHRKYEDKVTKEQKTGVEFKKLLPVS